MLTEVQDGVWETAVPECGVLASGGVLALGSWLQSCVQGLCSQMWADGALPSSLSLLLERGKRDVRMTQLPCPLTLVHGVCAVHLCQCMMQVLWLLGWRWKKVVAVVIQLL